jgi:hypothetical protein
LCSLQGSNLVQQQPILQPPPPCVLPMSAPAQAELGKVQGLQKVQRLAVYARIFVSVKGVSMLDCSLQLEGRVQPLRSPPCHAEPVPLSSNRPGS